MQSWSGFFLLLAAMAIETYSWPNRSEGLEHWRDVKKLAENDSQASAGQSLASSLSEIQEHEKDGKSDLIDSGDGEGEVASHDECIPTISLPPSLRRHWLPSLQYLSASSNQFITKFKIDVSIDLQGCGSERKFRVFYKLLTLQNATIGISENARDLVPLEFPGFGSYDILVELESTNGLSRIFSAVVTMNIERTEKRRRFCYLIQTPARRELSHLKTYDSEVIQLVWRGGVQDSFAAEGIIYYPNSSWTQGRNRLFYEMHSRFPDVEFQYAVFLDDDAELEEAVDFGMNTGNAWRTFERYLIEWEPAVGFPAYIPGKNTTDTVPVLAGREVQTIFNFDQILVAYHWETWPLLLPYTEVFDDVSWWYCATVQQILCSAFFSNYRIQFNALKVSNPCHRNFEGAYKSNSNFHIPMGWMANGLTDIRIILRLPLHNPSERYARWTDGGSPVTVTDSPQKRDKDLGFVQWFVNPTIDFDLLQTKVWVSLSSLPYDTDHPYFRHRNLLQPYGVPRSSVGVQTSIVAYLQYPRMRWRESFSRKWSKSSQSIELVQIWEVNHDHASGPTNQYNRHPEDKLVSIMSYVVTDSLIVHLIGVISGVKYDLSIKVIAGSNEIYHGVSMLAITSGEDFYLAEIPLPVGTTGELRVSASLYDTWWELSEDKAFLANHDRTLTIDSPAVLEAELKKREREMHADLCNEEILSLKTALEKEIAKVKELVAELELERQARNNWLQEV